MLVHLVTVSICANCAMEHHQAKGPRLALVTAVQPAMSPFVRWTMTPALLSTVQLATPHFAVAASVAIFLSLTVVLLTAYQATDPPVLQAVDPLAFQPADDHRACPMAPFQLLRTAMLGISTPVSATSEFSVAHLPPPSVTHLTTPPSQCYL